MRSYYFWKNLGDEITERAMYTGASEEKCLVFQDNWRRALREALSTPGQSPTKILDDLAELVQKSRLI